MARVPGPREAGAPSLVLESALVVVSESGYFE